MRIEARLVWRNRGLRRRLLAVCFGQGHQRALGANLLMRVYEFAELCCSTPPGWLTRLRRQRPHPSG